MMAFFWVSEQERNRTIIEAVEGGECGFYWEMSSAFGESL